MRKGGAVKIVLLLLAFCLILAAVPAAAQTVYSNGPINGNTDAWSVSFGFVVSDTFNVVNNGTTITGASLGIWLNPGDTFSDVELSITSGENSGTTYFDQTVNFVQGTCTLNQYGYDVCLETGTFDGPTLNIGTYWLNIQSCDGPPNCDGAYWDENSGPSMASENSVGSIPSEAFTVLGTSSSTTTSTSTTTSVPEPSSILLLGSGMLGLLGLVRRRLF